MRKILRRGSEPAVWFAVLLMFTLACGGVEESTTPAAVEEVVEQVAEVASKALGDGGEVDETWPFTHREVDSFRDDHRICAPGPGA